MVQWLGFCTFTAEGLDSVLGWGTNKILQAMWPKKKYIYIYITDCLESKSEVIIPSALNIG